ncbi:ATPase/GTPase, AAA15 family [Chitinophaga sp. CF118]|uniref:AAA family ATPase n=1 Tax=Chitinophaga sp. CF118 TaxID=1884367 RepID=UPI0008F216C8|nr:ATP-binding protein [Chitinophaga sp. CF118]SFF02657.1 ATPase/GTPase, AAA15 family [Chitinophaga sp. CF118]
MIISFSIKNFRNVKDKVTLSFEPESSKDLEGYYITEPIPGLRLLKLGLIYGPNGSGKTTILKGLEFLRQLIINPASQKQELLEFSPFLFDEQTPTQESGFELTFVHKQTKYYYEVTFTKEAIIYEHLDFYSPKKSLVYERSTDKEKQLSKIKFGPKAKINKAHEATLEANTLWNNTVLGGFLKTNIDSDELRNVTDWFLRVMRNMITPETDLSFSITQGLESSDINKKNIIQFLKKADFNISDIALKKKVIEYSEEVRDLIKSINKVVYSKLPNPEGIEDKDSTERIEVHFQHSILVGTKESRYNLPYTEESEGTQRYFQLSGLLDQMLRKQNVIMIDELESSLHPDLLKHFLLLFLVNVKDSQVIATTHYRELLMERDILRDDVLWFTEKGQNGSMELYSLSDFDSSVVRDTTSIFNAYKSGKLGAVPQLSDYYLNTNDGEE